MSEITCPSGLKGTIRGMKVKEQGFVTDIRIQKSGRLLTEIVNSCWLKTLDGGAYPWGSAPPKELPWDDMLTVDRLYAFKEIRVATFGKDFEWEASCRERLCERRFLASVDLTQLPVKAIPDTSKPHLRDGTPFETVVDGKKVRFRFLLGSDDKRLNQLITEQNIPFTTAGYMARIISVEGIDPDQESLRTWVDNLDYGVGLDLSEKMDAVDGSIDTLISVICPSCRNEQQVLLPLVLAFSPPLAKGKKNSLPRAELGSGV